MINGEWREYKKFGVLKMERRNKKMEEGSENKESKCVSHGPRRKPTKREEKGVCL